MDPSVTNALLHPWETYGIIGSVVVALAVAVVFCALWIRSLVNKEIERLTQELAKKEEAYERLVETRRRTKEEPSV